MGTVFSRLSAIGMLCAYLGSFFVLIYSPLKSFIMGSPKELWPEKVTKLNKKGMPSFALWVQTAIVCVIIGGVAIASTLIHQDSKFLFNLLTSMSNVASTLPYLFLVAAFPFFKKRQDLDRPFEAFHSRKTMLVIVTITLITLAIANGFTIIQPFIEKDWVGAAATVAGPLVFGIFAWALYTTRSKRIKNND